MLSKQPVCCVPAKPSSLTPPPHRRKRGSLAYQAGKQAEDAAAEFLARQGYTPLARRLRTPCGEIDLLVANDEWLLAIEVKQRTTLSEARYALSPQQSQRLLRAFAFILETKPDWQRPNTRLDVLVIDKTGRIEQIEDALRLY
nr:YraN family protein [Parasaccharibacter sp. TMW2.1890]